MEKILICGATGFIGRNLVEYFKNLGKYEIIATYNKRPLFHLEGVTWRKADLRNVQDVKEVLKDIDYVVQAAATTSGSKDIVTKPYIHVTDNALMNSILLREVFEKRTIKNFIFFSCTVMYPSSEKALKETDFDANRSLNARYFGVGNTKLYIEKMCEFYSQICDTKFTAIRHSNIYGPHDKFDLEKSHVFGATITKVLSNTSGEISVWGEGKEKRDLLYVNDLCSFVENVLQNQKDPFALLNCGLGKAISIKDLVDLIIKLSGKSIHVCHDLSKPTIPTSLYLDCEKARKEIGWHPKTSLEEGIKKTIAWWKTNILV